MVVFPVPSEIDSSLLIHFDSRVTNNLEWEEALPVQVAKMTRAKRYTANSP